MKILTFDIEEWFHILDNESTKTEVEWGNYDVRIHKNMDKIFDYLINNKQKATFFVVGWIAKKYPEVVKRIDKLGFDIGSHTHMHQLMYNLSRKEVEDDLTTSINYLENITGKKIRYFRAPGFSITEKNKWVFEVLYNNGITHDSSIFPANRAHGGFPSYKRPIPSRLVYEGLELKEFPINTANIFGFKWVYSGGGYFRITPYNLINIFTKKSDYIMTYFHPRDFDVNQPILNDLNLYRRFKSYVGIKTCINKLERWTNEFEFTDICSADKLINWSKTPIVNI